MVPEGGLQPGRGIMVSMVGLTKAATLKFIELRSLSDSRGELRDSYHRLG